jgi:hypothetical protein
MARIVRRPTVLPLGQRSLFHLRLHRQLDDDVIAPTVVLLDAQDIDCMNEKSGEVMQASGRGAFLHALRCLTIRCGACAPAKSHSLLPCVPCLRRSASHAGHMRHHQR